MKALVLRLDGLCLCLRPLANILRAVFEGFPSKLLIAKKDNKHDVELLEHAKNKCFLRSMERLE